jgi:hypothetical protein
VIESLGGSWSRLQETLWVLTEQVSMMMRLKIQEASETWIERV